MSLTLCPECDFAPCICDVLESAGVTAQAIDEVTREMMTGESAAFARFLIEDLGMVPKEVESVRKDETDWDRLRQRLGSHSVIAIAWKRRLTRYDKRFLRGCGVKP